jgi:DNA-binding NarL/FixJ family response regulator
LYNELEKKMNSTLKKSCVIRVVIIDRQPIIERVLTAGLNIQFEAITICDFERANELRKELLHFFPDIIILSLDQMDIHQQMNLIGFVSKCCPATRIIVLRATLNRMMIPRYFQAGVSGYLSRSTAATQLLDCIELIRKGKLYISSELLIRLL